MFTLKRLSKVASDKATWVPLKPSRRDSKRIGPPQPWTITHSRALKNPRRAPRTSSPSAQRSRAHRARMHPRTTPWGRPPSSQTHEPRPSWDKSMNRERFRMRMRWRRRIYSSIRAHSSHPWILTLKIKWNSLSKPRWFRSRNWQMTKTWISRVPCSIQQSMTDCLELRMHIAWRACRLMFSLRCFGPMLILTGSNIATETNLSFRVRPLLLTSTERIAWRGCIRTTHCWNWRKTQSRFTRWDRLTHRWEDRGMFPLSMAMGRSIRFWPIVCLEVTN